MGYTTPSGQAHTQSAVAYHFQSNTILVAPFWSLKDTHLPIYYNSIMQRLKDKGLHVDIQILNNEASK